MQTVNDLLLTKNIRPSVQRVRILHYLLEHKNHPSAETIFQYLRPNMPMLSRTTVYNTLTLFCENHLVLSLDFGEGFLRYDADIKPHSHFYCQKCGCIHDIPFSVEDAGHHLPSQFFVESAFLYMYGICAACQTNSPKNHN